MRKLVLFACPCSTEFRSKAGRFCFWFFSLFFSGFSIRMFFPGTRSGGLRQFFQNLWSNMTHWHILGALKTGWPALFALKIKINVFSPCLLPCQAVQNIMGRYTVPAASWKRRKSPEFTQKKWNYPPSRMPVTTRIIPFFSGESQPKPSSFCDIECRPKVFLVSIIGMVITVPGWRPTAATSKYN